MPETKNHACIGVDWGTSNLRLYWISGSTRKIEAEIRYNEGIAAVSDHGGEYGEILHRAALRVREKAKGSGVLPPLIVTGMAASSIGWIQLPYGDLPFDLAEPKVPHRTVRLRETSATLVSGLCSGSDIMRGEETECLGLHAWLGASAPPKYGIILPGTHSKHVLVKHEKIETFSTFLTGEMFNLLSEQSILKSSLEVPQDGPTGEMDSSFDDGVKTGAAGNLLGKLFQVRARSVLHGESPLSLRDWLSGLLIGAELEQWKQMDPKLPIYCFGGEGLRNRYERAAKILNMQGWKSLEEEDYSQMKARAYLKWTDAFKISLDPLEALIPPLKKLDSTIHDGNS